jgi:3-oxoacyl-[acyl-carrier-protein] synthase I
MREAMVSHRDAPAAYPPAAITSIAARGPLGLSSLQVAMCVRARKAEPRSTQFVDKRGRFVGMCTTPGLRSDLHGYERLIALAAPALRAAAPKEPGASPLPLVLAVPEPGRPDDDPRLDHAILLAVAQASGVALDVGRSRTIRAGHAGAAFALAAALEELGRGAAAVLVGGVDSYYHPEVIAWLDEECRLHALDAENGFVPSEGAAFLLLERWAQGKAPRTPGSTPIARLERVEIGREESVLSHAPNSALTMTRIIARIASSVPGGQIRWTLSDVNGERHRGREWDLVSLRGSLAEGVVQDRMVDDLGDMGAAIGPMLGVIACELFRTGGAPGASVCVALHAEGAERGAFLLSREGNP